jgi:hypothetical protein
MESSRRDIESSRYSDGNTLLQQILLCGHAGWALSQRALLDIASTISIVYRLRPTNPSLSDLRGWGHGHHTHRQHGGD